MIDRADLTDDALAGTWRIWQRRRGHRYSIDDVATAWEACRERPRARRALDLGCGIGSVLLMVAYRLPDASCVGIEAQDESAELARRNVARNGAQDRVTVVQGDLRDPALLALIGPPFELITGTPPYQRPGTGTPSPDPQRAHARVELRGGVEDYLRAAARALAPGGRVVVCADARFPDRVLAGGAAADLRPLRRRDLVPRADRKEALFAVWTLGAAADPDARDAKLEIADPLIARDATGARTAAAHDLRRFFDLPVAADEPPSP